MCTTVRLIFLRLAILLPICWEATLSAFTILNSTASTTLRLTLPTAAPTGKITRATSAHVCAPQLRTQLLLPTGPRIMKTAASTLITTTTALLKPENWPAVLPVAKAGEPLHSPFRLRELPTIRICDCG